uniref:Uncharacterized protein n=1 Tax=Anguilla anguilla TaxID=7936 RepID=A0A0E9X2W2_ANGAN
MLSRDRTSPLLDQAAVLLLLDFLHLSSRAGLLHHLHYLAVVWEGVGFQLGVHQHVIDSDLKA